MLDIDGLGLDELDRNILTTIHEKYDGGPVGISTLAAACSEEVSTIEDVYEPYLLQLGFLNRTPRGRVITKSALNHLGAIQGIDANIRKDTNDTNFVENNQKKN